MCNVLVRVSFQVEEMPNACLIIIRTIYHTPITARSCGFTILSCHLKLTCFHNKYPDLFLIYIFMSIGFYKNVDLYQPSFATCNFLSSVK